MAAKTVIFNTELAYIYIMLLYDLLINHKYNRPYHEEWLPRQKKNQLFLFFKVIVSVSFETQYFVQRAPVQLWSLG